MEKKAVARIILTLLLVSMLCTVFNVIVVRATGTIYIRADGSIDPPIAHISSIDNVTYTFFDNIYEEIVVERSNVIVDGAGYTLQGVRAWYSKGVYLCGICNGTIRNINIKEFWFGVYLTSASSNTLFANNITNNVDDGIHLTKSSGNTIRGNNITDNGTDGIIIEYSSNNNIVSGNNITNKYNGICLQTCSNNTIFGNKITAHEGFGIFLGPGSSNNIVCGNKITENTASGIRLNDASKNVIYENNITNNYEGIRLEFSSSNTIFRNNIAANKYCGVVFHTSVNNKFYHNNFIDNTIQVVIYTLGYTNFWDDGYPSGGNYWSDYTGVDLYCTPYQNASGSDGIGDTPYVIDEYNRDRYPLMSSWTPSVAANVNIEPDTLNLKSNGQWITAYVELPEGYDVSNIDAPTLKINGTIAVDLSAPTQIGDYDLDGLPDLMVKFDRGFITEWLGTIDYSEDTRKSYLVTFTITGKVLDKTFEGSATIRVLC